MADKTEFEAINEYKTALSVLRAGESGGLYAALPEGYDVHSLESLQEKPNSIEAKPSFRDTKSLAIYVDRFSSADSIIFSSPSQRQITCALDYHGKSDPSHCRHNPIYQAIFTAEYEAWRGRCERWTSQIDAGIFLEDRARDVIEPDSASIMDMVMQFDALKKVTFRQSTRLHDGQRQFTYNEENEVRGNVTLPEKVVLLLPVFDGQEPDRIDVRVRYKIEDGSLRFKFEIADKKSVEDAAFRRCEDALASDLTAEIPFLRTL